MSVLGTNQTSSLKKPSSGNCRSSICCIHYLFTVIDRLEQFVRGEPEYDYVREDGVWGEEAALVGWILMDYCKGGLDRCTCFLCVNHKVQDNIPKLFRAMMPSRTYAAGSTDVEGNSELSHSPCGIPSLRHRHLSKRFSCRQADWQRAMRLTKGVYCTLAGGVIPLVKSPGLSRIVLSGGG